ncbi:MAG: hypothetical protein Ct9H90mV1_0290 [Prasinovirus sp.]|nr:MAG: hypothetical protein Ct9H90mV1_0290 [Prasinovirus sp.]|tara:strand:- start:262 stop:537 length:276 start_codon:yes stop_codon:yes gene_type:complete
MEAEVGTPIEYNPDDFINESKDREQDTEPEHDEQYYIPPQHMYAPQQHHEKQEKYDIFANLDKTGYVIIFVAFLLGFFMGKTMQPVILRPG